MQWSEFCEKAKEMGYVEVEKFPYGKPQMAIVNEDVEIAFYKDGTVECEAYNVKKSKKKGFRWFR